MPREKLIGVLEASLATPVIVVSASPGWGKTTLLAQWGSRSQRPFAWVSVDERDNDPIVLLTYVAVALDRISPVEPSVFDALASPGVSVEATVVPRLGAALATMKDPLVLVLDDLHLVDNPTCLDAVASLSGHVSEGSQMVLSARGGPVLALGALRARGLALEIGPDDLRMAEAEARQLMSAAGVKLPDDQVAELTAQTEGWSAGLYLAALSIRARGVKTTRAFSGSDRLVADYLRSELLAHVSQDEFRFLTRTAVLERMSAPLCDAVLETTGSAAALESLERSNLFLVPLDPTGESYRYHHLFKELLRSELARAEPDLVPVLLGRAADWCEANGHPETAIGYAQEAGDVDRVARLVEHCAHPAYESGRVTTVERWLGWLDVHGGLERYPAVAVLGAITAAVHGRPAEADRFADAAERGRAHHEGPLPDGSTSIDSWLALLRAVHGRSGVARMHADADLAVRTIARSSSFWPAAALCLAVSHWLAGEIDLADDLLADVAEEGLELGGPEAAVAALAERAAIAIGHGAWVRAEELVNQALRVVGRSRMGEYPSSALVWAVAARVALRRGEVTRAQRYLAQAQRLRSRLTHALPWWAVQTRLELARAYLTIADAGGARTMLREVDALLRRRPELGTLTSQVEELRSSLTAMHAKAPGVSTLTTAELRLIPYLATHLTFREIGQRFDISHHTVKTQAIAIYRKLNVTSRNDAVERARELGLL